MIKVSHLMRRITANKVLLTGATGFVGSALATGFLTQSIPVLVLSRNDPDGARTTTAILEAADGFSLDLSHSISSHLSVIDVDFSNIEHSIPLDALTSVKYAWHCSAEMSYSPSQLASSFQVNVGISARLFQLLCAASPGMRRFHYISTAYVAGMQGGLIEEQLHAAPSLINTYQMTKWGAEQALHMLHRKLAMPLTIFRPSIVVGHSRTGWTSRNGFGFYMFLDALRTFSTAGDGCLTFNYRPDIHPDFIPIDQLVRDAVALTMREESRAACEVFHCTGGLGVSNQELMSCLAEISGVPVTLGHPVTEFDKKFERAIKLNMPFANTEWQFVRRGIDHVLGCDTAPEILTSADISRLANWYLDEMSTVCR
jgi:nucleoside-diphosphate-sugar epimerase